MTGAALRQRPPHWADVCLPFRLPPAGRLFCSAPVTRPPHTASFQSRSPLNAMQILGPTPRAWLAFSELLNRRQCGSFGFCSGGTSVVCTGMRAVAIYAPGSPLQPWATSLLFCYRAFCDGTPSRGSERAVGLLLLPDATVRRTA